MIVNISTDPSRCKRCGLCAKICPSGRIVRDENRQIQFRSEGQDACMTCGLCVAVCPRGAISATGVPRAEFPRVFAAVLSIVRRRWAEMGSRVMSAGSRKDRLVDQPQ